MKRVAFTLLVAGGTYLLGVGLNDQLIRHVPKVARFFAPPFFQFSESTLRGRASPFEIGMSEGQALLVAKSAGLVPRLCAEKVKLDPYDFPAALCFDYPTTGIFWDVWVEDGSIVGVRTYSTFNLTSE